MQRNPVALKGSIILNLYSLNVFNSFFFLNFVKEKYVANDITVKSLFNSCAGL